MERAKTPRACTRKVRVQSGNRAEITDLPFAPGSPVEIIVVGPEPKKPTGSTRSIHDYTDSLIRKKKIPRYSMKQIEKIIHQGRHSHL